MNDFIKNNFAVDVSSLEKRQVRALGGDEVLNHVCTKSFKKPKHNIQPSVCQPRIVKCSRLIGIQFLYLFVLQYMLENKMYLRLVVGHDILSIKLYLPNLKFNKCPEKRY